jgi:hypothetical protein
MDADRFDLMTRSLLTPSRRGFSRTLAGLGLVGSLSPLLSMTEAEAKKKGKKNKKKCKKSQKKCGKKCIPKTSCCTSVDCAGQLPCINGACDCGPGRRPCTEGCIHDVLCSAGCIQESFCCEDSECDGTDVCVNGGCICGGFLCEGIEDECCAGDEVCNHSKQRCEPGGCPSVQFCDRTADSYTCSHAENCACTISVNGGPWCVDRDTRDCSLNCTSDAQCGPGRVCISRRTSTPCFSCTNLTDGFCMALGSCPND